MKHKSVPCISYRLDKAEKYKTSSFSFPGWYIKMKPILEETLDGPGYHNDEIPKRGHLVPDGINLSAMDKKMV